MLYFAQNPGVAAAAVAILAVLVILISYAYFYQKGKCSGVKSGFIAACGAAEDPAATAERDGIATANGMN